MWNRSYRWQRLVRGWTGGAVLAAAGGLAAWGGRTGPAQHALDSAGELLTRVTSPASPRIKVDVPAELQVRPGHVVHAAREDGLPQIVGRVVMATARDNSTTSLELELARDTWQSLSHGALLRGAPPARGLEAALRLVVSPEAPRDEALLARDALWPTVQKEIVPGLTENLLRELRELFSHLGDDDRELVLGALDELRNELAPLEEELISRVSTRAWDEIGVRGVAGGLWRLAVSGVSNRRKDVRDWFRNRLGYAGIADRQAAEFLEREHRAGLRQAMEQELQSFWKQHQHDIMRRAELVLGRRKAALAATLREHWGPALFERAVAPAWLDGEDQVLQAVEVYARDFTSRRLTSGAGGPRLVFAHALRGVLGISDAPLLIIEPDQDASPGEVRYQPVTP